MNIIKTQKDRELLTKLNIKYNPNCRFQYCKTFNTKEKYINNIKQKWSDIGSIIFVTIASIITIPFTIYFAIQSLFPYSLVITKKELIEGKKSDINN